MKILVTGRDGLVGNSLQKLTQSGWKFVGSECDLTYEANVDNIFSENQPDYVIHTAAKVGGIGGNEANHSEYFITNILMNTFMLDSCARWGVKKAIFFSSVCVFPDNLAILQEDRMHDGPPYSSNFAYAYAKRMIDVGITAYKKTHKINNYCSVIPGNIFGEHDWYSIEHGHVIPSLIHKLYLANEKNGPFYVWGDGNSLREFLYVDDVAKIVVKLLELDEIPQRLIISGNKQYSIKEIVDKLVKIANFKGNVIYETNKPNGQRSRPTDLSLLNKLFPDMEYTDIDEALTRSWEWFAGNYPNVRM